MDFDFNFKTIYLSRFVMMKILVIIVIRLDKFFVKVLD